MVKYNCIRCGYTTLDKSKMKAHFTRKTLCKPKLNNVSLDDYKNDILNGINVTVINNSKNTTENTQNNTKLIKSTTKNTQNNTKLEIISQIKNKSFISCEYCKKKYSRKDSLTRHLKLCKEKKKDDNEKANLQNLVEILNDQLKEQKEQLSEQNKRISELIKNSGINIGTQNIQQNIKILAYKNTDLSHLTDNDYLQCLNRSNMVIPHLIKRIHFNPKKPENHNVYISNIKNRYIMIYDGNKWNLRNRDETIDNLIDTNEDVLEQKLEEWLENGKEYPEIMKKFNRYLEKKEKDEVKNKVKEEIKLILFNNRKVFEGT